MNRTKLLNIFLILTFVFVPLWGGYKSVGAMPVSPVDETQVPHYFGPNANWANSPFTLPDAAVVIDPPPAGPAARQATAEATVGANGAVTGFKITDPGGGYTSLTVGVTITSPGGGGTGAAGTANVTLSGIVTGITINTPGAGYTSPALSISGDGTGAAAVAYGSVDAVMLSVAGNGYSNPTVDFDMPDDPNGVQATGHVTWDTTTGAITGIILDNPGSGYANAPKVVIRDGTLYEPVRNRQAARAAAARQQVISGGKVSTDQSTQAVVDATATATISLNYVLMDTFGAGYSFANVAISDTVGTGAGASATASVEAGGVTSITINAAGSGYITGGGIQKFTDILPILCDPAVAGSCSTDPLAKYLPLAVPEQKMYNGVMADEMEIALVQYRTSFSSSLKDPNTGTPVGTLVRGYVQIETPANAAISQHFPLYNEMLDGTRVPVMKADGVTQYFGVTPPQFLGPIIAATKDKPVRIVFRNLLPKGAGGDLFLPVDSSLMGSGQGPSAMTDPVDQGTVTDEVRNPYCTQYPKDPTQCFIDSRATLHLHGGITPWISDGTAHQWITPADSNPVTQPTWPQGVSVASVPDMGGYGCDGDRDGCMTFYYTNQQSARFMFYHDHAWGITRLNVYAGEAAGYLISDATEKKLMSSGAALDGLGLGIPLVIQDRTFVPQDSQLYNQYDAAGNVISYGQDPTWDASRWGGYGNLWYHHVYMPAQNPGDPGGMSAYGRWMYGPWFWPPAAATQYGPIANPYYNMDPKGPDGIRGTADDWSSPLATPCNLDDPATWQYDTDPFCEPEQIPGTPNLSAGMEQFNDTPVVNGVAYPTITLEPKTYRFRVLNAANDRFFNFQWYVGDPTTASTSLNSQGQAIGATEVALKAAELAAAQLDPVVFPTPDVTVSLPGPDWVQIGTEGGFLPAPVLVDGQQITTWITDPTRFDVGNVDLHSLLLAPAERADVIVDFSKFAGQTLILYNDAPAAFPARVPSYDYYTGGPDMRPIGAPTILPGYGPNTRTIMQVKIAVARTDGKDPANPVNWYDTPGTVNDGWGKLQSAFKHNADGSGVFESGQHPIIVGQAAYNSAYGKSFSPSSNCNAPGSTLTTCDGFVRVSDTSVFGFNTLSAPTAKMTLPLQPKAIHDEMNATTFDEFGRMQANLGIEAQPPTPGLQNVTLYPFVNPQTELLDGTNLPKNSVVYDSVTGLPVSDLKITPISSASDGTQIWRVTHNGVDTHPIHFHLYDVQVINRVTWDNIIIPTDLTELGWKDTVRMAPLEDTIVALRPIIPQVPWELPNAIRPLSPMMPAGGTAFFNNIDPQGNPTAPIVNQLVNFGWEYVWHCHILSHEEMDMMRPQSLALPPNKPDGLSAARAGNNLVLTWNDNSINETSFLLQKSTNGTTWTDVGTSQSPLNLVNTHGTRSLTDTAYNANDNNQYRVVAKNTVGYGSAFPSLTVQSMSEILVVVDPPAAPTNLTAVVQAGPQVSLAWRDNATNETGFVVERSTNGGAFVQIATAPARVGTGPVGPVLDTAVSAGSTYAYRVGAVNLGGTSWSNIATVTILALPGQPVILSLSAVRIVNNQRVTVTWSPAANAVNYRVQWSSSSTGPWNNQSPLLPASATSYVTPNIPRQTWWFRVGAINSMGTTWSVPVSVAQANAPDPSIYDVTLIYLPVVNR